MTQVQAQALALGLLGALALVGVIYALVPREMTPARALRAERWARNRRRLTTRASIAAIIGLLVAVVTGWPVAGLGALALVMMWDKVAGGAGSERAAAERVEALANFTETLRDTMAGAAGLEQAIPAAARAAHPLLVEPLANLVTQLRARTPIAEALQGLADELDDPEADIIIAALIANSQLRGPGLRNVLSLLAEAARDQVAMRQRITAQRGQTRTGVRIIVIVTVGIIAFTAVFDKGFVSAYDSALGEGVLAAILCIFAVAFAWMRKLSEVETGGRILQRLVDGAEQGDQA